jgi:MerR family transcriptional regulator/heat shock protein HspR
MAKERERPVYIISIAAQLGHCHPQTLRIYERKGLLRPLRSASKRRLYSEEDIERLKLIQELTQRRRINLAGVRMILELEDQLSYMREVVGRIEKEFETAEKEFKAEVEALHRRYSPKIEKRARGGVVRVRVEQK